MDMDADDFWDVYVAGRNKETEDRAFLQWVVTLPYIEDKAMHSFPAYFAHVTGQDVDKRPKEVIIAEVEEAMRRLDNGE